MKKIIIARIHLHLEKYLRRAITHFEKEDYPFSFFCGSTLVEEIGKIGTIGMVDFAVKNGILEGRLDLTGKDAQRKFRMHRSKQIAAVALTLHVNSRVSRIYREAEKRFARWYRKEEFFRKRNESLYVEIIDAEALQVPEDVISMDDAFLMTCMAGECLAEIQGEMISSENSEHERILSLVEEFRESNMSILERIRNEESNKSMASDVDG
ncbi:MAG: AbiV family abortive infection protein [Desulfovermiculus sp.]|nr:AbiV family abortive infection protein [Desulfovermiculus sp.]